MKNIKPLAYFLLLVLFIQNLAVAQVTNTSCGNAAPFCTGQTMNFPAQTGVQSGGQPGPSYGCLGSQPNPTWFYMQMLTSGPMVITMSSNNDIDFICWGPFSALAGACNSLTSGQIQSCSYSASNTETCTIANAIAGQFYILLITNFSNQVQNITFQQANANAPNAGTTNCGLVCMVTATNSGVICAGQSNTITCVTSTAVTSYSWFGPNGYVSSSPQNFLFNLNSTTTYTVLAAATTTVGSSPVTNTCQAVTTISVVPYPNFIITPTNPSICQGGSTNVAVSFAAGTGTIPYTYYWSSAYPSISNILGQNTGITPPLQPPSVTLTTLVYSVTVSPQALSCPVTKTVGITINNPLTPSLTMPAPQCNTNAAVSLTATPGGGTWTANSAVSAGGLMNPGLAAIGTNTVMYTVSVGTCQVSNKDTFYVAKFNTAALTSSLPLKCSQDGPVNLMNIVQNTLTGQWSGGPYVVGNAFVPTNLATGSYTMAYNTVSTPTLLITSTTLTSLAGVCPDNTVLTVQVFNPPTPTIVPINPLCNIAGPVTLTVTPSGGQWSQNPGVSINGIQTPSLCAIGNSTVLYTQGIGTCVASSTAALHVSKYNTAALSGSIANLCVTSPTVNLMNIVQNTLTGVWTGVNVYPYGSGGYYFNPNGLPTAAYSLKYSTVSTPSPQLCPDSTKIAVSVLNPPVPNIALAGPFCSADPKTQLTVTPVNSGTWTTYSYMNNQGIFTPSLAAIGANLVQYVTGTSTCSAQQSKFINVEAYVPATILRGLPDQCNTGQVVNLQPLTNSGNGTWSGNGVQGSFFNPGNAGAGAHVLTYSTSSIPSGLCPDHSTLSVKVFSLATPILNLVGPFCNNSEAVNLQVIPVGGVFSGFNNAAVSSQGQFNPALAIIGGNIVSYSISSGPCIAYAQATVQVDKFVSATLGNAKPVSFCSGDKPLNMLSYALNQTGNWSGFGVSNNMFNPSQVTLNAPLTLTYTTHSLNQWAVCPDMSTISVIVNETPTVQLTSTLEKDCAPAEILLTMKPIGVSVPGFADWYISDGTDYLKGLNVSHVFKSAGSYSVVANFISDKGCSTQAELEKPIKIKESPITDFIFSPEEITINEPLVELINQSKILGNNTYTWTVQGLSTKYEVNSRMQFPTVGTYVVSLKSKSFEGCVSEKVKTIEVKNDFNAFIPSSFTPNSDGLNDVFFPVFSPYGLDFNTFEMTIFDRWGEVLYQSKDATRGWDGSKFNKGDIICKPDSYVYIIKFKDLDGRLYQRTGHVILLAN